MAKVARSVTTTELDNTANWYFDLDNIRKATDTINNFMDKMELPNLFKKKKFLVWTALLTVLNMGLIWRNLQQKR